MRILVVEDEKALQNIIKKRLTEEGYSIDCCDNGEDAVYYCLNTQYDCVILDIMLPKLNGFEVLKKIRSEKISTPVLALTALDSVADRVCGLDSGADDYLIKPFSFEELLARLRSLLRRHTEEKSTIIEVLDLSIDTVSHKVKRGNLLIELTSKEYALLEYLARNKGSVLSRSQIAQHVWNYDFDCDSNIVDVYIRYLRGKIDDKFEVKLIKTIRGSGYSLREEL